jgi:hypothetical protein
MWRLHRPQSGVAVKDNGYRKAVLRLAVVLGVVAGIWVLVVVSRRDSTREPGSSITSTEPIDVGQSTSTTEDVLPSAVPISVSVTELVSQTSEIPSGLMGAAGSVEQLNELWFYYQMAGPLPKVDFSSSIVVAFTTLVNGCDSVTLVEGEEANNSFVLIPGPAGTSCDLNSASTATFLVVDRRDLPSEFSVEVRPPLVSSVAGMQVTVDTAGVNSTKIEL